MAGNYSSANLTSTWNSIDLSEGLTAINFTPNGAYAETTFDLGGQMTMSMLANQGGVLELTYLQTSKTVKKLLGIGAAMQVVGQNANVPYFGLFSLKDPTGNTGQCVAWNTALVADGGETWGETVGERTFTFNCEKLIYSDNPASIAAAIVDYGVSNKSSTTPSA